MQPGKLLIMALTLLLVWSTAAAASAVSLHAPWRSSEPTPYLDQLFQAWGSSINLDDLKCASPLETLPGGAYVIEHYASGLNTAQILGIYLPRRTPPTQGARPPTDATLLLTAWQSGNWTCNLAFAETSTFAFFDAIKKPAALLTTEKRNSASCHSSQAGGFIYDLGEINPLYAGQYLIAFEDHRITRSDGNLDFHGLVVHVSSAPLPGTLPLVAGGLFGLLGFRWRRKHSTSPP